MLLALYLGPVRYCARQVPYDLAQPVTHLELFIFTALLGLDPALCWSSVVMIGFRSWPFLRFFPPFPLAALFAADATCLALLMAAFLISLPFMICIRAYGARVSI